MFNLMGRVQRHKQSDCTFEAQDSQEDMTTQRHTEGFFITLVCHLYAVKTQQARAMFQVGGGCKSSVYMLGWSAASPLLHAHSMPALPFRLCVCCTTTHGHGSCTDCQPAVQNTKLLPCLSIFPKTRTSRFHQHPDSACRYACHDQHDKQHPWVLIGLGWF